MSGLKQAGLFDGVCAPEARAPERCVLAVPASVVSDWMEQVQEEDAEREAVISGGGLAAAHEPPAHRRGSAEADEVRASLMLPVGYVDTLSVEEAICTGAPDNTSADETLRTPFCRPLNSQQAQVFVLMAGSFLRTRDAHARGDAVQATDWLRLVVCGEPGTSKLVVIRAFMRWLVAND